MRKLIIILQILTMLLFLTAHYLIGIYYYTEYLYVFLCCDVSLYLAIGLQLLIIVLLLEEVRK